MKRTVKILIIIQLCALIVFPASISAFAEGGGYLALGDSISAGYNLTGGHFDEECFVSIFASRTGLSKTNAAVDGFTAPDVIELLRSGKYDGSIAAAEAVTLTIGGNDMMNVLYAKMGESRGMSAEEMRYAFMNGNISGLSSAAGILAGVRETEEFRQAMDRYISELNQITGYIRNINQNAVIIVATQYNPYASFTGMMKSKVSKPVDGCIRELNSRIIENAQAGGYRVADVYTAFEKSNENLCNASQSPIVLDFHPNANGHAVIAECFIEAYSGNEASAVSRISADTVITIAVAALVVTGAAAGTVYYVKSRKRR